MLGSISMVRLARMTLAATPPLVARMGERIRELRGETPDRGIWINLDDDIRSVAESLLCLLPERVVCGKDVMSDLFRLATNAVG